MFERSAAKGVANGRRRTEPATERRGTIFGIAAYLMWGLFPLFWPLLEPAGALEILAHRVVWSLVVVGLVLLASGNAWRRLPRTGRPLGLLTLAAVLIAVNWGLYIWGVNHHHVVETSLGYFINPLVTVTLSVFVLGERLRRLQWTAVAIAAVGVIVLTIQAGSPPSANGTAPRGEAKRLLRPAARAAVAPR